MAGGAEIDDAQAGMTEDANAFWRRPKAAIIRPSMGNAGDHLPNWFNGDRSPKTALACNSTHTITSIADFSDGLGWVSWPILRQLMESPFSYPNDPRALQWHFQLPEQRVERALHTRPHDTLPPGAPRPPRNQNHVFSTRAGKVPPIKTIRSTEKPSSLHFVDKTVGCPTAKIKRRTMHGKSEWG